MFKSIFIMRNLIFILNLICTFAPFRSVELNRSFGLCAVSQDGGAIIIFLLIAVAMATLLPPPRSCLTSQCHLRCGRPEQTLSRRMCLSRWTCGLHAEKADICARPGGQSCDKIVSGVLFVIIFFWGGWMQV